MLQLQSAFGVFALLAIAWALGENRRAVSLRQAAIGLAVTLLTALLLIKLPLVARAFGAINDAVGAISSASRAGTSFVFGYLGGGAAISLQRMLGYAMAPVCWLLGLPWPQAITAGSLMGTKTVLNELIAYVDLSKLGDNALDPRSRLIMLYAMCGFANFGSLGIMIGGLGTMAPERRDEINSLGLKSIVSGTLTTCLMGAIVGLLT
jgi:nucleoside permease NupC